MTAVGNAPNLADVDYDPFAHAALARVVPVTEPQREVWLADKLGTEGSLAFNESVSIHLRGPLDSDALAAAVRELAQRHESLRATLSPNGDELCIAEDFSLELDRRDLSTLNEAEREAAVRARQQAAVETPFDLEQGPLVRAELLVLNAREHVLLLNAHHIVCDGWSFGVLVADLAALYAERTGQGASALPTPVSFADYAWSRAGMSQAVQSEDDARYWLSRFSDIPSNLDLPTDRPRPRFRDFRAGREDVVLDAALVASLRKLGARNGASLFATMFTGFSTLMRRLSGQSDVVVGIAAAGQSLEGYGALVGHCVNILPVRTDAMPGESFASVLAHTGSTLLDAFEHQQYTFGTLLQKLSIPRDPGRLPLVSVLFNLDQSIDDAVRFPGLEFEVRANARSYENFELFVNAVPENGGLRLECQYSSDLFDAATVRRWLGLMETMLRAAVDNPDAGWDALEWLSASEADALSALQPAPSIYDAQWLVHQRFEARAADTPDAAAVTFGDRSVTYAMLDGRANAIAHALRERGVGRGALVGVCVHRSPDLLAATLGILKAGGAFVPLDPTYPADRLNYMVGDANLVALLAEGTLASGIDFPAERVLAIDTALDADAWRRTDALPADERSPDAESPAYVIYTSGSTGKPKGVVVPHRALVNHLTSMAVKPGLSSSDSLVAVTTTSFDISILELFLPLVTGARIVLAGRDDVRDGMALRRLVEESGATVMQATPSGWRVLIDAGWEGGRRFKALCGGEGLPPELVPALLPRVGELWNMYGPTETTIWSTCARIDDAAGGTPIGTPIANTTVRVLDEQGRQCPVGVPGELWIGGDGVTLGYLNRPELTDERFVVDPWAARDGARMYRTGDRGRWRNDGRLEHLGRLDFQVKVRGYRIELGEIESNLAAAPGIGQCVVMAREDRPGDLRLVGYVVAATGNDIDEAAVLERLRAALPDYMVPQHLVQLPALPLTLNGKVDRKALPAPDLGAARAATRVAPRNDLERSVAAIMESVLALPDIGIDDDFFALGGHSLLAAQLTSRLNRELGVGLTMRALFDAPTVARLAALIAEQPEGTAAQQAIPRRADQSRAPLSLMQERVFRIEQFNPGTLSYNTPSAHRLRGALDVALLDRALRDLAQRQTVLRTAVVVENDEPVQVLQDDIETGLLQVEDLSQLPSGERDAEIARRMHAVISVPFGPLDRAPLFRAQLFRVAADEHVLFFMPHHVIWDGWSFDLLYAQLSELYAARVEGRAPNLPELPVTYGDYSVWHREWVQGPEYAKQLAFWRDRLSSAGEGLDRVRALPTDRPRKPGMSGQGRTVSLGVPKHLTVALRETGLKHEATLFVTLLSAYYTLMTGVTGERHHIVGTPVRGRNSAQVEDLMGYFTNLLPLYVSIDTEQPFTDVLKQVKGVMLDSFAHPDVRLEDLVGELSLRGSGRGAVLYQSLFSFQDIRQRVTKWGPLQHERVEVFQPGATEDLGIWFIEDENGLSGGLIYNADIFDESTAQLLRDRYLRVLEAIVADPSRDIAALATFDDGHPARIGAAHTATVTPIARAAPVAAGGADATADSSVDDARVRYLIDLWTELLGTPARADDNFFDLGGNSMLGVQMSERVARDTGLRINLVRLAAQDLGQIAAELPENFQPGQGGDGLGSRLVRNVKRLFGRSSLDATP